jgi:hypothetical protein
MQIISWKEDSCSEGIHLHSFIHSFICLYDGAFPTGYHDTPELAQLISKNLASGLYPSSNAYMSYFFGVRGSCDRD